MNTSESDYGAYMKWLLLLAFCLLSCGEPVEEQSELESMPERVSIIVEEPYIVSVSIREGSMFIGQEKAERDVLIALLMSFQSHGAVAVEALGEISSKDIAALLEICSVAGVTDLRDGEGNTLTAEHIQNLIPEKADEVPLPKWMDDMLREQLNDLRPAEPSLSQ